MQHMNLTLIFKKKVQAHFENNLDFKATLIFTGS